MNETLINILTAYLAKQKGFKWKCNNIYLGEELIQLHESFTYNGGCFYSKKYKTVLKTFICAPSQTILQKWLRENHYTLVSVDYAKGVNEGYHWKRRNLSNGYEVISKTLLPSYEKAMEIGLQKALELI